MICLDNQIEGVVITQLREIADNRGTVLHMLRIDSDDFTQFGECYFSELLPGAIKAWKMHKVQTQNIAVPIGRIRLVIYDNREDSLTKNSLNVIELGRPDAYLRIKIPPKLWYGFMGISLSTSLLANCVDIPHDKTENIILDANDKSIPHAWK